MGLIHAAYGSLYDRLGHLVRALDAADELVEIPGFAEFRREVISLYLDALSASTRPFDGDARRLPGER